MSVLFIICQAPKLFPDLYEVLTCTPGTMAGRRDCPMDGAMQYVMELSHLCVCINSTLNFAIYSLRGEKFKAAWKETYLGSRCCNGKNGRGGNQQPRKEGLRGESKKEKKIAGLIKKMFVTTVMLKKTGQYPFFNPFYRFGQIRAENRIR